MKLLRSTVMMKIDQAYGLFKRLDCRLLEPKQHSIFRIMWRAVKMGLSRIQRPKHGNQAFLTFTELNSRQDIDRRRSYQSAQNEFSAMRMVRGVHRAS
eukprot:scaffold305799_cov32-Tisochrysis_lutea.AAC.2